jgi:tetratricopeptide (TPR) repeat protein
LADLYLKNRFADAARVAEELLARSPRHAAALLARARWSQECGERSAAVVDLERLLSTVPKAGTAYNIGILNLELARYEDAKSSFETAARLGFQEDKVLRQQTLLSFYEGDFDRMLSQAERLTRLRGEDRESWHFLTIAAQMTGDEDVYRECRRVLEAWGDQS